MFNLNDILMQAQGGEALANLSRQFGLPREDIEKAVGAMMPAYAAAIRRQMAEPETMQRLFAFLSAQAGLQAAFQDGVKAFSPTTRDEGEKLMGSLFGSPEGAKAISDHVARVSGLTNQALEAMMPVVTAMLMGGLSEALAATPPGALFGGKPEAGAANGFADLFGAMFGGGAASAGATGLVGSLFGADAPKTPAEWLARIPNPVGPKTPVGDLFGEFWRGYNNAGPVPGEPPTREQEEGDFGLIVARLFEAGRDAQESHVRAIEDILDRYGKTGGAPVETPPVKD